MHLPYTDRFPEAVAVAGQSVGAALDRGRLAPTVAHPRRRTCCSARRSGWRRCARCCPRSRGSLHLALRPQATVLRCRLAPTLATLAMVLHGGAGSACWRCSGNSRSTPWASTCATPTTSCGSLYLMWFGLLLGVHALLRGAPLSDGAPSPASVRRRSFARQDAVIFSAAVGLALVVDHRRLRAGHLQRRRGREHVPGRRLRAPARLRADPPVPVDVRELLGVPPPRARVLAVHAGLAAVHGAVPRLGVDLAGRPGDGGHPGGRARAAVAPAGARARRHARGSDAHRGRRGPARRGVGDAGTGLAVERRVALLAHDGCACFAWAVESLCDVRPRRSRRRPRLRLPARCGDRPRAGDASGGRRAAGVGVFLYFVWALSAGACRRALCWRPRRVRCFGDSR